MLTGARLGLALSLGLLLTTQQAPASAGAAAARPFGLLAYVTTSSGLVPVELATGRVRPTIRLDGVQKLVVSPDGTTAWVVASYRLREVDLRRGTVGPVIDTKQGVVGLALSPDGRTVYGAGSGPVSGTGSVVPVDTATGTPRPAITVPPGPSSIAISPNGRTAYVAAGIASEGNVVAVNLQNGDVSSKVFLPVCDHGVGYSQPGEITVAPDGATAYVTDTASGCPASVYDTATGALHPIGPIWGGVVAVTPDSSTLAIITHGGDLPGGTCSAFLADAASGAGDTLPVCGADVAMHPRGDAALVVSGYGSDPATALVRLDLGTRTATVVVPDLSASGVAVAPDQAPTARFVTTTGRLWAALDAGGSRGTTRPIVRYDWVFGDGTRSTTTTPRVRHVYARAGSYRVQLTVTDDAGTSTQQVWGGDMLYRNGLPRAQAQQTVTLSS